MNRRLRVLRMASLSLDSRVKVSRTDPLPTGPTIVAFVKKAIP